MVQSSRRFGEHAIFLLYSSKQTIHAICRREGHTIEMQVARILSEGRTCTEGDKREIDALLMHDALEAAENVAGSGGADMAFSPRRASE